MKDDAQIICRPATPTVHAAALESSLHQNGIVDPLHSLTAEFTCRLAPTVFVSRHFNTGGRGAYSPVWSYFLGNSSLEVCEMIKYRRKLITLPALVFAVSLIIVCGGAANTWAADKPPASVPAPPLDFAATAGDSVVTLTWTASSDATGYHLYRADTRGGSYRLVGAPTSAAYVDKSVTNGTTYYYVVCSLDSVGESANSLQVHALPGGPIPAIPAGLSAAPGNGLVTLSWSPSSGATSYRVYRADTHGGS